MRYICLAHFDPKILDAMPPAERQDLEHRIMLADDELRRTGQLIRAEAIQAPATARLVRVRGGKVTASPGPLVERQEQLGGFILIEARDLNEAIAIAGRDPLAAIGTIEVRPIYEIPTPP